MYGIRPADSQDIKSLAALIGSLFAHEPDFSADTTRQEAGLRLLLADPARSLVLVAFPDGSPRTVVGMLTVQLVASTAEGAWSGLVEDVVIEEAHRGRGLGRSLLSSAEDWAVAKGATRMQLLADRDNGPALAFYERQGYAATRMICRRKAGLS